MITAFSTTLGAFVVCNIKTIKGITMKLHLPRDNYFISYLEKFCINWCRSFVVTRARRRATLTLAREAVLVPIFGNRKCCRGSFEGFSGGQGHEVSEFE